MAETSAVSEHDSSTDSQHCVCVSRWISYQLATFMTISKLATYLSAGDVTGLQNALFHDLCPGSYRVAQVLVGHTGSALGSGFVFGCMSSVDMICKYVYGFQWTYVGGAPHFDGAVLWRGVDEVAASPSHTRHCSLVTRQCIQHRTKHHVPQLHRSILHTYTPRHTHTDRSTVLTDITSIIWTTSTQCHSLSGRANPNNCAAGLHRRVQLIYQQPFINSDT